MSYIPDYRNEVKKLNDRDYQYYLGYKHSAEDAASFFDNIDIFYDDISSDNEKLIKDLKECFEEYTETQEIMVVCSLFECNREYDALELKDGNESLFNNTKAKNRLE